MKIAIATLSVLLASQALAQKQFYSFAERSPSSKLEKTIHRLMPSVVKVHGASGLKTVLAYASGVVVSKDGHVLTLDQVLIQPDRTKVVLHDGTVCQVEVLPASDKYGVRMLKIVAEDLQKLKTPLQPLMPAQRQDHGNGTFVVSLGNCFRLAEYAEKQSATLGVVTGRVSTGLRYRLQDVDYHSELLITDAANNPGQYGGGLFTLSGEWIGLNTKIVESIETNTQISAAIPTGDLRTYIQLCIAGKSLEAAAAEEEPAVTPVFHGIRLFDQGRRVSPPAYVERVIPGSPAASTGLRPDDLIVQLDEYWVTTCKDFQHHLRRFKPGSEVQVTFKRGTRILIRPLTFAEVKDDR